MLLLILPACAPPADSAHYRAALATADFDSAWAECAAIRDSGDRGDCQQAAIARFSRFEACGGVESGTFREECYFSAAENLARAKDRTGALQACKLSSFAVRCSQHVLDGFAMDLRDAAPGDVGTAWASLAGEGSGANAELDFWRSWHRVRIAVDLPVDAAACPGKACRDAARAEIRKHVDRGAGATGCAGLEPGLVRLAAPGTDGERWAALAFRERCPGFPHAWSGRPSGHPARGTPEVEPTGPVE